MIRPSLSPRQQQTLDAIRSFESEHARTPSVRELAAAMSSKSLSPVQWLLDQLESRGYIRRAAGQAYSIVVVGDADVAAGYPLPADLQERLIDYCAATGQSPSAVVHDAVLLHLDEIGPRVTLDGVHVR